MEQATSANLDRLAEETREMRHDLRRSYGELSMSLGTLAEEIVAP